MKKMSRRVQVYLSLLAIVVLIMSGCGQMERLEMQNDDNRIRIVCTIFPQYDWVLNLIKGNEENISLTLLMDKGGDLHNFQPSALDIAKVSDCDLFIYVGGESDTWVDDALKEAVNPNMRVINMMEAIQTDLVEEEHLEGLKEHTHPGEAHEAHEHAFDEHVWLSLRNTEHIVAVIANELAALDDENTVLYQNNFDAYAMQLKALDERYREAVQCGQTDTLLFADRFPFRYLMEDYDLNYYAAFDGCSAETEASFETVAFLVNKMDELGLGAALVIDGSDERLAQVIIENTKDRNQQILILNSLQAVSRKDMQSGLSYLSAMEENLKALKLALNSKITD